MTKTLTITRKTGQAEMENGLQEKAYREYVFQWLLSHKNVHENVIRHLTDMFIGDVFPDGDSIRTETQQFLVEELESRLSEDGCCFACRDEFFDNEWHDEDTMREILSEDDFRQWQIDFFSGNFNPSEKKQINRITADDVQTVCEEFANQFSSFLIIGKTLSELVEAFNADCYWSTVWIVNAIEKKEGVYFDAFKTGPEMIFPLTEQLQTIGYAATDWDECKFICAENGHVSDDYTAFVEECRLEECTAKGDMYYELDIEITDRRSGALFCTGGGYVTKDDRDYLMKMVEHHGKSM